MASDSVDISFDEAVGALRSVIGRIRESGLMKDTEFKFDIYQPCTRSAKREAEHLDKYLDIIVQARFEDGSQGSVDNPTVEDDGATGEEIPFQAPIMKAP
jgi:hypothetical protein